MLATPLISKVGSKKHQAGSVATTRKLKPRELEFFAAFRSEVKALESERYLKSSSGFAFRNKRLIDIPF